MLTGATPIPVSGTVNVGLMVSLVVRRSDATRVPAAVGVNMMLTVQLVPGRRLWPQVVV